MNKPKPEDQIYDIENRYGTLAFRAALSYLIDIGWQHVTAESAKEEKEQIMLEEEKEGVIISKAFQCAIVDIAVELTGFSIWDLLRYVKKYLHFD